MGFLFLMALIVSAIVVLNSMLQQPGRNSEKVVNISSDVLKKKSKLIIAVCVIFLVIVTVVKSIVIVPAGHRFVVSNIFKGVLEQELDEGKHLTTEGLQIGIDLTLCYMIDPEKVAVLHRVIGPNFEAKILRPSVRSTVRHHISEYAIMDVYSKRRKEIANNTYEDLNEQLKANSLIVDAVKLRDVIFTEKFAESIEKKQVAQQEMERWEYIKKQREKEADARIIEAKGKAEAMRIIAKQLKANPDIIKYNYVEKPAGNIQVIVTDQSTILDLKGMLKSK